MSPTQAGDRSYYIDDYADEIMPCDSTLEAWADWLSKPDADWSRDEPTADGSSFQVSILRWGADIVATRAQDGTWSFDRDEPDATFHALRFGPGAGWDADAIVDGLNGVREHFAEYPDSYGPIEYIAVGFDEPQVRYVYRSDPPRLVIEGTVQ